MRFELESRMQSMNLGFYNDDTEFWYVRRLIDRYVEREIKR
jgi:hypothetical protein